MLDLEHGASMHGRSLAKGETTVAELKKATNKFPKIASLIARVGTQVDAVLVDGDLTVPSLSTARAKLAVLVVRGNLTVEGLYEDSDDPACAVVVLGHFRARNVKTSGALAVTGDVRVDECLLGRYNDYSADLRGTVTARVFAPERHYFALAKRPRFEAVLGEEAPSCVPPKFGKELAPLDLDGVRALLVKPLVNEAAEDGEDPFDGRGLVTRVLRGKPVLRATARRSP